ncbi:hypothetical protein [Spongiactinospora gelatinilytica]|uniref:hypothetical protein n=1 Tax=Spongiactinospora gelatinilytica TaxID=2666298 RepID=UPI0011B946E9|nr:hypothetical protein [Spongiactinospora gelatinilytica]
MASHRDLPTGLTANLSVDPGGLPLAEFAGPRQRRRFHSIGSGSIFARGSLTLCRQDARLRTAPPHR